MDNISDCHNSSAGFTYLSEFNGVSSAQTIGETLILSIVFVIAVCGNILVLVILMRSTQPLISSQILLVNQTVSQLILMADLPLVITTRINVDWIFGEPVCKLINYSAFASGMSFIFTLIIISYDRYLCVEHGGYKRLSRRTAAVIILLAWTVALALSSPVALSQKVITVSRPADNSSDELYQCKQLDRDCKHLCRNHTYCGVIWPQHLNPQIYLVSLTFIFFILPFILSSLFYYKVYKTVKQSVKRLDKQLQTDPRKLDASPNRSSDGNKIVSTKMRYYRLSRLAMAALLIVGSFVLMWLPFFLISFLAHTQGSITSTAFVVTLLLTYANAGINPLIHMYFSTAMRQQLRDLLPAWLQSCVSCFSRQPCMCGTHTSVSCHQNELRPKEAGMQFAEGKAVTRQTNP